MVGVRLFSACTEVTVCHAETKQLHSRSLTISLTRISQAKVCWILWGQCRFSSRHPSGPVPSWLQIAKSSHCYHIATLYQSLFEVRYVLKFNFLFQLVEPIALLDDLFHYFFNIFSTKNRLSKPIVPSSDSVWMKVHFSAPITDGDTLNRAPLLVFTHKKLFNKIKV